ncbi:hypothetical protein CV093_13685 [Oceanobacillus sp. 143]|nr:hypothetical protein CV093_13685 [Oceanobacillus sp. 143]
MFENFEVKPLFEDQVHERHQFELNFQGIFIKGISRWRNKLVPSTAT